MIFPLTQEFAQKRSFPLDPFQRQGCQAIEQGHGVLVCAPTGAGKTVVGEFAVAMALRKGTRCFYTTPIKALSNQKYHDLLEEYGEDAVGLLTGDQSINRDAQIVVMTTEVLRNMIYSDNAALGLLSHVVMDEIHFLGDRSRGAVWEEVILNLDESVTIVGLSATVSNAEEFGRWLNTVRGQTDVIVSEHRPVPLNQWMMVGPRVYPLFEPGTGDAAGYGGDVNASLERAISRLTDDEPSSGERHSWKENGKSEKSGFRSRSQGRRPSRSGRPRDVHKPMGRPEVLKILENRDMLPAITFIFSRAGCDAASYQCLRSKLILTDQDEADEIGRIVDAGVEDIPEEDLKVLNFRQWRAALQRGFAAHHAGMLPAFRHIVEELFVRGLVRAVFATETLALGINMPARSVVLEKTVKFNGDAHVDLTPGEYTQLTGRAGRRGIDIVGNAVVQWSPAVDPQAIAGLASTRTYPLISTFEPGYNMSINLLDAHGYEGSIGLLESSFAQFQADGSIVGQARDIDRAQHRVRQLEEQLADTLHAHGVDTPEASGDVEDYAHIRGELSRAEKDHKKQARAQRQEETARILARLDVGEVIAMPTKKRPLLAVVVSPARHHDDPAPMVIAETGWSGRVEPAAFGNPPVVVGRLRLPRNITHNPRKNTRFVVRAFKQARFDRPKSLKQEARVRPSAEVKGLRAEMKHHPVHSWPDFVREEAVRVAQRLARRRRDLARLTGATASSDTLGKTFARILDLLAEMDYVEVSPDGVYSVTDEGQRLSRIHSESDLLVAQCLKRGVWDGLDPAELAGVASMCVFENRKETRGAPEAATEAMATAMNATERIWTELSSDERRYRLPVTREPEAAFALAIHQWTAGAPLGYALAAAAESGAELSPGDFVRWCRQVIDILGQIAATGYSDEIKRNAHKAIDAIQRGVVAVGS